MTLIPKRMIFIWLGPNEVPDYGKFSMDTYRKVNPDFEMMFVREKDVEHPSNPDFAEMLRLVHDVDEDNTYKKIYYRKWAEAHLSGHASSPRGCTRYADVFRAFLLNKYGGVYLDLDTFPVRPFDDKLLSSRFKIFNRKNYWPDSFFLGFPAGCCDENVFRWTEKNGVIPEHKSIRSLILPSNLVRLCEMFKILRKKFFGLTLKYGERVLRENPYGDYYIDHYWRNTYA